MPTLRIGTCSWKFPSWQGLVYSAAEGIDYLEEYAQKYDTVEIDQWFWSLFPGGIRLPRTADVRAYRQAVPDTFRFTVKVPNSVTLTHFYKKEKDEELAPNPDFFSVQLFQEFLELLEPIRPLLGPLMFQFEYLNKQKMPSQARWESLFEAFLNRIPSSYPYAVEIRNPNYLNAAYFQFLNRHHLAPVLLEGYYMPPVVQVYEKWRPLLLEQKTAVIRLHGPDREGMEETTGKRWDKRVAPKDQDLAAIADMVKDLLAQDVDVYVNVNNHYEGSAPLTIKRIEELFQ